MTSSTGAPNLLDVLLCPACRAAGLRLIARGHAFGEPLPESGIVVCDNCGHRYPIRDHILDLGHDRSHDLLTTAGRSNLLPLMPQVYEHVWRPRSVSLLTHGRLTVARELQTLLEWLEPRAHGFLLDIGTSTGLYARTLARAHRQFGSEAPLVVALDLSRSMLETARRVALRDGLRRVACVRASAESLPFASASFRLVVCGGSLNEFRSPRAALREAERVLAPGGRFFAMSLDRAQSPLGQFAQGAARRSGIRFPSRRRWDELFVSAGFNPLRRQTHGVVALRLLGKGGAG